jgi:flagellar protein FliS
MSYASRAYSNNQAETDVSSSNSKDLILLVYERVFDNLRQGKREIEEGKYGIHFFSKASDLIHHGLLAALDHNKGGDISRNLDKIYKWALQEIIQARAEKSSHRIQNVIDTLTPLYEAWAQIIPSRNPVITPLSLI